MSRSPASPVRRIAAVAAALLTTGAMSLTLAPSVATAATPKITGFSVTATKAKVRTSTGKSVRVDVSAYRFGGTPTLMIGASTANEYHNWDFPIANSHFTLTRAGKGKIAPAVAKVYPFAKVALTVKPAAAAKTQKCQGQAVSKTQRVKVTGTFWLDTKSGKRWGKIGSKTKRFTFSTTSIATWNYANTVTGCGGDSSYLPPCVAITSWGGYSRTATFTGEARKLFASRSKKLVKPAGAMRYDSRTVIARSAKFTQDSTTNTAKMVVVGNGTTLKGSATLVGRDGYTDEARPCKRAGKKVQSTYYPTVSYTNGSKPLTATDIYGAIRLPNSASGYLWRSKVVG